MSVSTNLRTDILKMYDYNETISQTNLPYNFPKHIEVQLDNFPVEKPYLPRIDGRQAHMFLWLGKKEEDGELYEIAQKTKGERQWVQNNRPNTYIKGVGMFHIYDEYVIVGSLKYAGYMKNRPMTENRKLIRQMWCDTINIFKNKDMLCPSGTYFDWLHLTMNQMRAQKEPYHREIMWQFGFDKVIEGKLKDYWIRNKECKTGLDWIGKWI